MAQAGQLMVRVSADTKRLQDGMKRAKRSVNGFNKTVSKNAKALKFHALAVAAAVAGLGFLTKKIANTGDKLAKLSSRVNISVEKLSSYTLAAELAGSSLEGFAKGQQRLARAILEADQGLETYKRAFRELNIEVTDNAGNLKSSEQVFLEISDRFHAMEDGSAKTALAMQLMGRGGVEMINMLNQGSVAIQQNVEDTKRLGAVWSTTAAKKAEAFNDSLTKMRTAIGSRLKDAFTQVAPSLTNFINWTTDAISGTSGVNKNVRDMAKAWKDLGVEVKEANNNFIIIEKSVEGLEKRRNFLAGTFMNQPHIQEIAASAFGLEPKEAPAPKRRIIVTKGTPPEFTNQARVKAQLEVNKERIRLTKEHTAAIKKWGGESAIVLASRMNQAKQHVEFERQVWSDIGNTAAASLKKQADATKNNFDMMEQFAIQGARGMQSAMQEFFFDSFTGEIKSTADLLNSLWRTAAGILSNVASTAVTSKLFGQQGGIIGKIVPGLASGGPITGPAIVGEKGPELFMPGSPGRIIPNNQLGGGRGGVIYNQHIHVHNPGVPEAVTREMIRLRPMFRKDAVEAVDAAIRGGTSLARTVGAKR